MAKKNPGLELSLTLGCSEGSFAHFLGNKGVRNGVVYNDGPPFPAAVCIF
jgi:hypothetical protein